MTTPLAYQLEQRAPQRRTHELVCWEHDVANALLAAKLQARSIKWPSDKYREDPVQFARDIIGFEPWARQREILEAARDYPRVAVASGHKVSKSHSAACVALWFYCSFPDARVVLTSTTSRQVDQILWRELRMMKARGGLCVACKRANETRPNYDQIAAPCEHSALLDGVAGELARTGLKSQDFREIVGFTASEAEAVAGISGRNLLYIPDEASGIDEAIFEAIEGNRAGGARVLMFSNPTKTKGEFFNAFHSKKSFYHTIQISSEETPNVLEGREVIPGLATREWIEEKKREWGENSPMYLVRVKGQFATKEDGKIFPIHSIEQAELRWHCVESAGRLFIGLDPSGMSGTGDECIYAPRRGLKLLELRPAPRNEAPVKLEEMAQQTLVNLLLVIRDHALPRETPVVVVDRDGPIGKEVCDALRAHLEKNTDAFELVALRSSDKAHRQPQLYDRMRDELAANFEAWIRDGGGIPEDAKLSAEMHVPVWIQQSNGKYKYTRKEDFRAELGRSPDRYDAAALSCWEPLSLSDDPSRKLAPTTAAAPADEDERDPYTPDLNPYEGAALWGRR